MTQLTKEFDKKLPKPAPMPSDYLEMLKAEKGYENITDIEAEELLNTCFQIMKSFVSLGYGLDPVNNLIGEFENSSEETLLMINSEDAKDEE